MKFPISLVVICFVLLSSCKPDNRIYVLTDEIDTQVAAELFNRQSDDVKVVVEYRMDLARFLTMEKYSADLVIGRGLDTPRVRQKMASLGKIPGRIGLYSFFEKHSSRLLPLSFDLPVVYFSRKNQPLGINSQSLGINELRELGRSYNQKGSDGMSRMGFIPLRYDDFLYLLAVHNGVNFRLQGKSLLYDDSAIAETLTLLESWSRIENGGYDQEKRFIEKFGYIPDARMLKDNRMLFSFSRLSRFMELQEQDRTLLEFRYFSSGVIILADDTVFAGIPLESLKKRKAKKFLLWLVKPENQRLLMEYKQAKRMNRFGFLGGLSTLPVVNENMVGSVFPLLLGRIPAGRVLGISPSEGDNWMTIRNQVIVSWLRKRVTGETDKDLKEYYSEWLYFTVTE